MMIMKGRFKTLPEGEEEERDYDREEEREQDKADYMMDREFDNA